MKKIITITFLLLASIAQAGDITLSTGYTNVPKTFEHARFAFPDLAQGGPGCCDQAYSSDSTAPAFKLASSKQYGAWGVEGSLAYLGTHSVSFEVSGPFGGSVSGPGAGRCVESGTFGVTSLALAGTYSLSVGPAVLVPKLGLAGNWLNVKTQSHCDLANYTASVNVSQDYTVFSMSPLAGVAVKLPLTKDYGMSFEVEGRRVLFSDNAEAQSYGQGRPLVLSAWVGISRSF